MRKLKGQLFNSVAMRKYVAIIRDLFYYSPIPGFRVSNVVKGKFSSTAVGDALKDKGICILENFLSVEEVERYQQVHNLIVVELIKSGTARDSRRAKFDYDNIDFTAYPIFLNLLLDELFLSSIESYYGRPICLALSKVQRLLPVEPYEENAFQWHHDTKGKYVKVMCLLSDVPEDGQRMSYVIGSHRIKHRLGTYEESRFTENQARNFGEVIECAAPIGSVVIFDANGLHRGNRNLGPIRDVVFGVYTTGRFLQGCQFHLEHWDNLSYHQKSVLIRSQSANI